jgi:hypothetical protein
VTSLRQTLRRNRAVVYMIAGLVLLAAPLALFSAASALNETACWLLLGLVSAAQAAVIAVK